MEKFVRHLYRPRLDCRFNKRLYMGDGNPWAQGDVCSFELRLSFYYMDPPVVNEFINIPEIPVIAREPDNYLYEFDLINRNFIIQFVNEGEVPASYTEVKLIADSTYYSLSAEQSMTLMPGESAQMVVTAIYPAPFVPHTEATVEIYDGRYKIREFVLVNDFTEQRG